MDLLKYLFLLSLFFTFQVYTPEMKLRGLRVDTAYFYELYPNLSVAQITQKFMTEIKSSAVNTLFIYAYNPVFGALYPTDYPYTITEGNYGQENILKALTLVAKSYGLKVIAVVPVNNFKSVWDKNPLWRSKTIEDQDYIPGKDIYLLSAWHPEFRDWLRGFYTDLLEKNPEIDGIEAVEPFIDYNWFGEADYNPFANMVYKVAFPNGELGDANWNSLRAQGLTDLIGIMNSIAHLFAKTTYLVQTWPAKVDGRLFSNAEIKSNIGLDFDGVLNLKNPERPDFIMAEFMWQQWAAEYGFGVFSEEWTRQAALNFMKFVDSRANVVVHLEISPFSGRRQRVIPTKPQFLKALQSLRDLDIGIEVYDYSQISKAGAWPELRQWY